MAQPVLFPDDKILEVRKGHHSPARVMTASTPEVRNLNGMLGLGVTGNTKGDEPTGLFTYHVPQFLTKTPTVMPFSTSGIEIPLELGVLMEPELAYMLRVSAFGGNVRNVEFLSYGLINDATIKTINGRPAAEAGITHLDHLKNWGRASVGMSNIWVAGSVDDAADMHLASYLYIQGSSPPDYTGDKSHDYTQDLPIDKIYTRHGREFLNWFKKRLMEQEEDGKYSPLSQYFKEINTLDVVVCLGGAPLIDCNQAEEDIVENGDGLVVALYKPEYGGFHTLSAERLDDNPILFDVVNGSPIMLDQTIVKQEFLKETLGALPAEEYMEAYKPLVQAVNRA